jgi:mRNA interferase RelE/StbE
VSRRIDWAKRALKELARLDRPTRERILSALSELADSHKGDVRRLEGAASTTFRLRVGSWRVILSYEDDASILVQRVRPRGDAYKR